MVHRVDGPVGVYRGFDDGTDGRIADINRELADATILQSRYSLDKHRELGFELRDPVVIPNAVDPAIFHPPEARDPLAGRPLRVDRHELVRQPAERRRRRSSGSTGISSRDSRGHVRGKHAGEVRAHPRRRAASVASCWPSCCAHTTSISPPSRDDPCSNALLEALACGLPAAFRRSGGHPELVGEAGIGFDEPEELPACCRRLADELDAASCRDSCRRRLPTSPTATSKCCADEHRAPPAGCSARTCRRARRRGRRLRGSSSSATTSAGRSTTTASG